MNRRAFFGVIARTAAGLLVGAAVARSEPTHYVGQTFRDQTMRVTPGSTFTSCLFVNCIVDVRAGMASFYQCHFIAGTGPTWSGVGPLNWYAEVSHCPNS